MTRQSLYEEGSEFSEWLRKLGRPLDSGVISNHNLDYIWHNYRQNWLILIEEKRYCGHQTFSQRDTHSIVDQMLRYASGCLVKNARGKLVKVEYRGYFLIVFEKTSPDDSGWMEINGRKATKEDLFNLLRTGYFDWHNATPGFIERKLPI